MTNILMYISNGLIIGAFTIYFLLVVFNRKKQISESNGFDVTKDILSDYNRINIIESKSYFTVYNIKRKVVKIASNCYYGKSLSDISLPVLEAGTSIVHNKNEFMSFLDRYLPNIKCLYALPLIAAIINSISFTSEDAKVGILIIVLISLFSYELLDVKTEAKLWIDDNLKKIANINHKAICSFINKIILLDKIILIAEFIIIIRFVALLLG